MYEIPSAEGLEAEQYVYGHNLTVRKASIEGLEACACSPQPAADEQSNKHMATRLDVTPWDVKSKQ